MVILSVVAAVLLALFWFVARPELDHPGGWRNRRLADLGRVATVWAAVAFAVAVVMLSPLGRMLGAGALGQLRPMGIAYGLGTGLMAIVAMRIVDILLRRARREAATGDPDPDPDAGSDADPDAGG